MSAPQHAVLLFKRAITGTLSESEIPQFNGQGSPGGVGIDAGGRIQLGTATSATVLITDSKGTVLYSDTATASVDIAAQPIAVLMPLLVTVSAISNASHTLTVYWGVKK